MNGLQLENPYLRLFIKYSLPVFAISIISRTFPIISFIYFIVPILLITYILLAILIVPWNGKRLSSLVILFTYPLYCILTSLWSLQPVISIQRSLYQLVLYAGILSAVYLYNKIFPEKAISFLVPANVIIVLISFLSLIFNFPENAWSGGNGLGFMGFAGHQNTLAAGILFTLPGLLVYKIKNKGTKIIVIRIFYFLLLTFNLLLILLTYSRASILALAIGIITYLLLTKSKKILAILFSLTAILIVLSLFAPPLKNSIDSVLNKDGGNLLDRRKVLWEPSLQAAKLGGLIGLGYGVSAPNIKSPILTGSHFEDGRYIREKGNSTLAVIEETGWIGLFLFLLPVFWVIRKFIIYNTQFTIKEKLKNNYAFYIIYCALLVMLIHSQFEAWWVGPGSVQLPLYLIVLFTSILNDN